MELGVELWLVDPDGRVVTVSKPGEADRVEREWVKWRPAGVSEALAVEVAAIFG